MGQKSNFQISKIPILIDISKLKLPEKSIGDGPRAPKCLLMEIRGLLGVYKGSTRGHKSNFRIYKILLWIAISRLKLAKKSICDGPRAPKCSLLEIRGI